MKEKNPQHELNGNKNLWIVKPGFLNRGHKIQVFDNFDDIMNYMNKSEIERWVVQKYIENPLIINSKKFDIRLWIVVTSWNPLAVWAYDDCYIRFAALEYDPSSSDRYVHLTNHAVFKQYCKEKKFG